jgi:hypothetical protein
MHMPRGDHTVQQVCPSCHGERKGTRALVQVHRVVGQDEPAYVRNLESVDCETCDGEGWVWSHG